MKQKSIRSVTLFLTFLLSILVILSSCGAGSESYDSNPSAGASSPSVGEMDAEGDKTGSSSAEQKRILKGTIVAESTDFATALNTLEETIAQTGGYVGSSEIRGNSVGSTSRRSATLVARIPSASFHDFLNGLSDFLNVTSQKTSSEDITESYYDTQSKLNSLKIQEERLLAMLEQAEDLDSLLKLEERLSEIRQQIQYYDSLLRAYDSQVAYASVAITLYEVVTLSEPSADDPSFLQEVGAALKKSFSIFVAFLKGLLLVLIYLLPLLLTAGIVLVLVLTIRKKTEPKRRARAKALHSQQNPPVTPQPNSNSHDGAL